MVAIVEGMERVERFLPTLRIALSDSAFEVLDLTVNPLFFINDWSLHPWPRRRFETWIELTVGHKDAEAREIPKVVFTFSQAFAFLPNNGPPTQDQINFPLYKHFWNNYFDSDLLKRAFGDLSTRLIPPNRSSQYDELVAMSRTFGRDVEVRDTVQGAMAFFRTNYYGKQRYGRITYPCCFIAHKEDTERDETYTLLLRPFDLKDLKPAVQKIRLTRDEAVSLWYYFPYLVLGDDDDRGRRQDEKNDLISFTHWIIVSDALKQDLRLNYFPRLPYRYEIRKSNPEVIKSPRLQRDPPNWERGPLYPAMLSSPVEISPKHSDTGRSYGEVMLTMEIFDARMQENRNIWMILLGVVLSFLVQWSFKDLAISVGFAITGFIVTVGGILYLAFPTDSQNLLGRLNDFWDHIRHGYRRTSGGTRPR